MGYIKRLSNRKNALGQHRYRLRYRLPGQHKQICETLWFANKVEAERYISQQRGELIDCGEAGLRWDEAFDIWMDKCSKGMNEQWVRAYEQIVREFTKRQYQVLTPAGKLKQEKGWGGADGISIDKTTRRMMSDFFDWRRDRRLATLRKHNPKTSESDGNKAANKSRQVLFALVHSLRREGVIGGKHNDFEGLPKRPEVKKPGKAISDHSLGQYLNVLSEEARLAVTWMLFTGWRSTPTTSLREEDIDETQLIATQVHKGMKKIDWPLNERLLKIIHMARILKDIKITEFAGKNSRGHQSRYRVNNRFVFVNTRGGQWNHTSLRQHCQKKWNAAGLPHAKIHDLRTTFATDAGTKFSVSMVQAALGHDCPASTEHYIDLDKMKTSEVSEAVQEHLSGLIRFEAPKDQGKHHEQETVTLICPELGKKIQITMKQAKKLFT